MDWDDYLSYAGRCREKARSAPCITEDEDADAQYFITTLPWIHYEQILMPVTDPVADNPRFCWGRYEEDFRGRLMMPFTVIVNHALMDGIHISVFFRNLQERYPQLTSSDLKFCALLRLNLSTKDIAKFANISVRGVESARLRLRKKFALTTEQNLVEFLIAMK